MNVTPKQRILEAVSRLLSIFGRRPTEEMLDSYVWALQDLDAAEVENACEQTAREWSERHTPRPKDIRQRVGINTMEPVPHPTALSICNWCDDTGLITIWQPIIIDLIQSGEIEPTDAGIRNRVYDVRLRHPELRRRQISSCECAVACPCPRGEKYAKQRSRNRTPRHDVYDDRRHSKYDSIDSLRRWLEAPTA